VTNVIESGSGIKEKLSQKDTNGQTTHYWKGVEIVWPKLAEFSATSYPTYTSLLKVVQNWNPDQADPPKVFVETLQHFNYSDPRERAMAEVYRNNEIPFKVYDVPQFNDIGTKWTDEYLAEVIEADARQGHVEKSDNNHFMYWALKGFRRMNKDYVPPTKIVDMSFPKWLTIAKHADEHKVANDTTHYYFMTSALTGDKGQTFIARDLNLFSTSSNNFFITNVNANKGIQCRFAMRGIIAEAHYDSGRNMVAMLKGAKRYILNPPKACKSLGIIADVEHPSYRHSVIDWSDPGQAASMGFGNVDAIDTIVRQGEVLYIPSYWLHYIQAIQYSIQCNSRSG
jgi:hypothetical protein